MSYLVAPYGSTGGSRLIASLRILKLPQPGADQMQAVDAGFEFLAEFPQQIRRRIGLAIAEFTGDSVRTTPLQEVLGQSIGSGGSPPKKLRINAGPKEREVGRCNG